MITVEHVTRVDYLLGVEAPELHRGSWKRLN
jgi:hypothetical protein